MPPKRKVSNKRAIVAVIISILYQLIVSGSFIFFAYIIRAWFSLHVCNVPIRMITPPLPAITKGMLNKINTCIAVFHCVYF
jgi:hypothetical protein